MKSTLLLLLIFMICVFCTKNGIAQTDSTRQVSDFVPEKLDPLSNLDGPLLITTPSYGYLKIGPNNGDFNHFVTDLPKNLPDVPSAEEF